VQLVRQAVTGVSVAFDDEAVADFFDRQVDAGRRPEQFARIWVHTHPGDFAEPSATDEATFLRVFGRTDWAMMFILARGGQSYARLRFHVGPGGDISLPIKVDYTRPFAGSDQVAWQKQYAACVQVEQPVRLTELDRRLTAEPFARLDGRDEDDWLSGWGEPFFAQERSSPAALEADYAI
jgi:hypothetical protein